MAEPILELRGLSRRFGALVATDAVTLDLRAGEIHALIGPNGAGKSTLIKQIMCEIASDSGEVIFAGRNLAGLDTAARARLGLARTFQVSSVAPEFSVLQNVLLAAQGAAGRSFRFVRPVLRDAALVAVATDRIARAGLAGRERIAAAGLSHGERRKLEIAMALALEPRALMLDEPMAGMGAEGARELGALLEALRKDTPILLVEPDMDAVFRLSDRITVLAEGRVIATGGAADIRANREVQAVYLGGAA